MTPSIERIKASDGTGNASVMIIQALRAPDATTISVDTTEGVPAFFYGSMGTPHTFVDPQTSEIITVISDETAVDFTGHIDGSNIEIDEIAPGYTDLGSAANDIIIIKPTTPWADNVANVLDEEHEDDGKHSADMTLGGIAHKNAIINAPQGFLINGKIVRTVSSNNLTVAIKTLAGNNPSATEPVHVRIGDTVRTITGALSITKNAGTNWFGAGATSLATFEIDYFVYLGYNATDGVTIGFARIPYARTYGDFSATSTAVNYAAISTITHAASTDEYELVGRFNATLSATASFNWSVPATSVIVNRPIFETRALTYSPALTNISVGNGTAVATYQIVGKQLRTEYQLVCGSTTTLDNDPLITLPMTGASRYTTSNTFNPVGNGVLYDLSATTGYSTIITLNASATVMKASFVISQGTGSHTTMSGGMPIAEASGDTFGWVSRVELI